MAIQNRLTQMLGIQHPVLLAPMDIVSGGRLAAAVSQAGGLGLLGGGYGDGDWIDQEWERAGNARIGCGFITWSAPSHADPPPLCFRSVIRVPSPPRYGMLARV
jgi:nitronate monooxygenase